MNETIEIPSSFEQLGQTPIPEFELDKIITKLSDNEVKEYRIGDLFRPVKKRINRKYASTELPQTGEIPLFSCKKHDNGIAGYVEEEEYEGDVIVCVNGRYCCGYCHHYNGKLAWTQFCCVIEPINKLTAEQMDEIAQFLTQQLAPNHNDGEKFKMEELLNRVVKLPII